MLRGEQLAGRSKRTVMATFSVVLLMVAASAAASALAGGSGSVPTERIAGPIPTVSPSIPSPLPSPTALPSGELSIVGVTASGDDGNVPENTIDKDFDTRWSADGDGEWIQWDLGSVETVGSLELAWFKGDEREAFFDIEVSSDGSSWSTVLTDQAASGSTLDLEAFGLGEQEAQYVRYAGHGNNDALESSRGWNSITEVEISGASEGPPPTEPPPTEPPSAGECEAKPDASTTGPRYEIERTLTASEALAELRQTGELSQVRITGQLNLEGSDGVNWVISDSVLEPGGSRYGVMAYIGSQEPFTGTPAQRPRFEYVELRGGAVTGGGNNSALFYGASTVWYRSELHGGIDVFKPFSDVTIEESYAHDLDHPEGAHSDVVQIVSGTGIEIRCNNLVGIVGYGTTVGSSGNAVLQTGSVTGAIQAEWVDNWVNGGHYTIRVSGKSPSDPIDYWFSGNRQGRTFTYGPLTGDTSGKTAGDNVWDDTGEVLW